MRDDLEQWLRDSMDTVRLSGAAKQKMTDALLKQAARQGKDENGMEKRRFKKVLLLGLAAALVIGAMSAGAAYLVSRARTLEAELHMTDEQRQRAEESGLSSLPDAQRTADEVTSATGNGVTVTVEQAIADSYFAMLSFRVEGVEIPQGAEPFVSPGLTAAGKPVSWSGGFYNGIASENGRAARYDDGSPLEYSADGSLLARYVAEDGSLHYCLYAMGYEAGALIGSQMDVSFTDFGFIEDNNPVTLAKGTWNLCWTLRGSDELRTEFPNRPVGDSGAVLTEANISPISLRAVCRLSDEMSDALKNAIDDDEVIPRLLGVRMKDGTLCPYLYKGPGAGGSPGENLYETRFAVDRILEPQDIDAFLFLKSYPEGEETLSADNLYIVPLDG